MACKCSDCPEVGCRFNRLNMAAQEMCENCLKTAKLIEDQIERCKRITTKYENLECIMFHKIASLETILRYVRNSHAEEL